MEQSSAPVTVAEVPRASAATLDLLRDSDTGGLPDPVQVGVDDLDTGDLDSDGMVDPGEFEIPEGWPENDPEYLRLIGVLPPLAPGGMDADRLDRAPSSVVRRMDTAAAELDELTRELCRVEAERAGLDARRAAVLARGVAWAARHADDVVSLSESPARRRELAHRELLAEFATAIRVSERSLAAQADRAAALVAHPDVHSALAAGAINIGHVAVILDEVAALTGTGGESPSRDAVAEFERRLLERARVTAPGQVRRAAKQWREKVLPDSLTIRHERALRERRVWIETLDDAMGCLHATGPIDDLARIRAELTSTAVEAQRSGDPRGIDQIRVDTMLELLLGHDTSACRAGGADSPDVDGEQSARRVLPSLRVVVTVPVLTLAGLSEEPGQLDGHGPIPPEMARRLTAHAPGLTRVLTHPVTGTVLDVDRTSYRIPASLRTWLLARDSTCRFPWCSRRAVACDVDHTVPWEYGGTTSADNLAHLCRTHHRLKGLTDWRVEQDTSDPAPPGSPPTGGTLHWTSPTGRRYTTYPAERLGGSDRLGNSERRGER